MSRFWLSVCIVILAIALGIPFIGNGTLDLLSRLKETSNVREKNSCQVRQTFPLLSTPNDLLKSDSEEMGVGSCKLKGNVNDCSKLFCLQSSLSVHIPGCDFSTVNQVNKDSLYPLISKLTNYPFFKYFKVPSSAPHPSLTDRARSIFGATVPSGLTTECASSKLAAYASAKKEKSLNRGSTKRTKSTNPAIQVSPCLISSGLIPRLPQQP